LSKSQFVLPKKFKQKPLPTTLKVQADCLLFAALEAGKETTLDSKAGLEVDI
jgi:hypothetical protein